MVANSKVRPHTSAFFTKEVGVRIIATREDAIAASRRGAAAQPEGADRLTQIKSPVPAPDRSARTPRHHTSAESRARRVDAGAGWRR